jgi:hypothetical protein
MAFAGTVATKHGPAFAALQLPMGNVEMGSLDIEQLHFTTAQAIEMRLAHYSAERGLPLG